MNTDVGTAARTTVQGQEAIHAAVRVTEAICGLPAVATQDWCERAASALLGIGSPSIVLTLVGHLNTSGHIIAHEATGAAGCEVAEVATTIGGVPRTSRTVVEIDGRDQRLTEVRARLDQARELGWSLGMLNNEVRATTTRTDDRLASSWETGPLGGRWRSVRPSDLILGVVPLSDDGSSRVLVVEIGLTGQGARATGQDAVLLGACLTALHRRALMAIGSNTTDTVQWLTQREQVILQHLLLGKSVRSIAEELGRSPHTVHDHVKSLHRKLNAKSRGELVARALGHVSPAGMMLPDDEDEQQPKGGSGGSSDTSGVELKIRGFGSSSRTT